MLKLRKRHLLLLFQASLRSSNTEYGFKKAMITEDDVVYAFAKA